MNEGLLLYLFTNHLIFIATILSILNTFLGIREVTHAILFTFTDTLVFTNGLPWVKIVDVRVDDE